MGNNALRIRENFLQDANRIHNNKYDYSKFVFYLSKDKGVIICPIHGEFSQTYNSHLAGNGCPDCQWKSRVHSTSDFIIKCKEKHGNRYDYPQVNYIKSNIKVRIICSLHGVFESTPNNHLRGRGCTHCNRPARLDTESFIKRASEKHNNFYDYSLARYMNHQTKIRIICPKHGEFQQRSGSHLTGRGCEKCAREKLARTIISKSEIEFLNLLKIPERSISIDKFIVDGYNKQNNTIYEFLGDYWHGNPNKYRPNDMNILAKRTFKTLHQYTFHRFEQLKLLHFNIRYIWESDWNDFKICQLQNNSTNINDFIKVF